MKMQCERCKEIVPFDDFSVVDDHLDIRCGACHGSFTVPFSKPAPAPAPAPDPGPPAASAPPAERCPKCDSPVSPTATACPSCGLLRDRFASFIASRTAAAAAAAAAPEVLAAWARVEADWPSVARHEEFAELVARHGAWAFGARAYRRHPTPDDPLAVAGRERLLKRAEASLLAAPAARRAEGPARTPSKQALVLLVLLVFLVSAAIAIASVFRAGRALDAPRSPTSAAGESTRRAPSR